MSKAKESTLDFHPALTVDCPSCKAPSGNWCVSVRQGSAGKRVTRHHAAREKAHDEQAKELPQMPAFLRNR